MNELLLWSLLVAAALVAVSTAWWRRRARLRHQHERDAGWRLIHELKAYGAWLGMLRGEYAAADESEETTSTAALALRRAGTLVRREFPALIQASGRLAQGDSRLVVLLWQGREHRAEEAAGLQPGQQPAPGYRDLLEDQLDLVEELIARCQVLIGDRDAVWLGTDMDPDFAAGFSLGSISTR